jgi:hypothetical protein
MLAREIWRRCKKFPNVFTFNSHGLTQNLGLHLEYGNMVRKVEEFPMSFQDAALISFTKEDVRRR